MSDKPKVTRRELLGSAAAALTLPYIIPSGVLAAPGRPGANDRIAVAVIGVGGRGSGFVRPDTPAICDVDQDHLAAAVKRVNGTPFTTNDYRHILDRKDIDAVYIGAPDHWHALMMTHACQAGKDVYVEKPACRTIEEGRAMMNVAKRYGRVVQVGAQGRSTTQAQAAYNYIRNGQLGRVTHVDIWHEPNWTDGWGTESAPPPTLDWQMWLGPARWVPYNPQRVHFNFRWFMDFGGGFIRDRGAHAISLVFWFLNKDHTGPVSVEATGTPQKDGLYDVPVTMDVKWEFKNPDWTLTWKQPGQPLMGASWGAKYYGDKDTLIVTGGDSGTGTEEKAMKYQPPAGGAHAFQSPGHYENWIECIRSREQPIMPIEAGVRTVYCSILGNLSYTLGRKLQWDPVAERVIGDEEADRLLAEPYRAPWEL